LQILLKEGIGGESRPKRQGEEHFILRFSKISLLLQILLKEGIGGESRPKRQGEDKVTLKITLISESATEVSSNFN
jgi:ribosomal protein L44E